MFSHGPDEVAGHFGYHPLVADADVVAGAGGFSRVLVLGSTAPVTSILSDLASRVSEIRVVVDPEVALPGGVYWFHGSRGELMLVTDAHHHSEPDRLSNAAIDDDHPLSLAREWFDHLWPGGLPIPHPAFEPHEEALVLPGGSIVVLQSRSFAGGAWMYTARIDGRMQHVAEQSLRPVPGLDEPAEWVQRTPVTADRFAATVTRAKLRDRFTDTVFSFRATRTLFRSYQFKPIMKLLQTGRSRLLIADEVGLGKTIEAGLVWTELEARRQADRVLVVCPAVLVTKWQREMEERFGFELVELDGAGLERFLRQLSTGRLPRRVAYITSLQRLRAWGSLDEAAGFAPRFDLVVVDEAHSMRNTETASFALGSALSEWAESLVLLTATPVNLRSRDLHSLLRLLVPGEVAEEQTFEMQLEPNAVLHAAQMTLFDRSVGAKERLAILDGLSELTFGRLMLDRPEIVHVREILSREPLSPGDAAAARDLLLELNTMSAVITRTRKVEVQEDKAVREPRRIDVFWNPLEGEFYEQWLQWCAARAAESGTPMGFSMQMPLRLAGSCLPAAAAQVLQWGRGRSDGADGDGSVEGVSPSQSVPPHRELVKAAQALTGVDSKFDMLLPVLEQMKAEGRRTLLFSYSRDTVDYLYRSLVGRIRVAVLQGNVGKDERHRIMADFRAGAYDLVLATRVASEGLDFEFCSTVVNYDLPWNPMEVEQRIGRLDRIGQVSEKILVVNFHTPGTIESRILDRILDRIGVFERSIGELEPIVSDQWGELRRAAFDFSLTEEQRALRTDQVLAAIETQRLNQEALQEATNYLLSSDDVAVDGMETDLLRSGRYVGQRELAHLLADWSLSMGGRRVTVDDEAQMVRLRGNAAMAQQVDALVRDGERAAHEVADIAAALRNESEIFAALDQEVSRTSGLDLLAASHPLVRAALKVPGHEQSRFASLRLDEAPAEVPPGRYLVVLSVAQWSGLRPAREVWTGCTDLEGRPADPAVGDAVFAAIAQGRLQDGDPAPGDLRGAVNGALAVLLERQVKEDADRRAVNDSLVATRRASLQTTHVRKTADIASRRDVLVDKGDRRMAPLFEGQLRQADERFRAAVADLELKAACSLTTEPVAVCLVEVPA